MRAGIKPEREGAGARFSLDPRALLLAALLASGVLLVILGSKQYFQLDEWDFVVFRPGWTADSILDPHAEHIVVFPVLVYKSLLAT